MKEATTLGKNKTGIQMSPRLGKEMIAAVKDYNESLGIDFDEIDSIKTQDLSSVRSEYAKEAESIGTVPLPVSFRGAGRSLLGKLKGQNSEVLIDKLTERLGFERTGVRMYEALIDKCEASHLTTPLEMLREFRDEELEHFFILKQVVENLGADPTAQTPSADVLGVASQGILQILTDPRTSVSQCAHAILIAELTDNAGWDVLIRLCEEMGMDELRRTFSQAAKDEENHLIAIRNWHCDLIFQDARRELDQNLNGNSGIDVLDEWSVPPIT